MSRSSFSAALITELRSGAPKVRVFVHFEFDGGDVRAHTGLGEIIWGGFTWLGVGSVLDIPQIEESIGGRARSFTIRASGITSDIVDAAFLEDYINRPVTVYVGALDANDALVADPDILITGTVQNMVMTSGASTGEVIDVICESSLARLDRTKGVRYTKEQLQSESSGSRGFEFIAQMGDRNPVWRGKTMSGGGDNAYDEPEREVVGIT